MMVSKRNTVLMAMGALSAIALAVFLTGGNAQAVSQKAKVITLTQTGCQFVETEGVDHGYRPKSEADCKAINARTSAKRLAGAKTLTLKPGRYIFRVTNKNVPYQLGFYLRGEGVIGRLRLPKVAGGGLFLGTTKDYEVELKEGNYLYSCPLNPTPDYKLVVRG